MRKLRRKARRLLVEENRRLAHVEERARSWRYADPYDPATSANAASAPGAAAFAR